MGRTIETRPATYSADEDPIGRLRSGVGVLVRFVLFFALALGLLAAITLPLNAVYERGLIADAVAREHDQYDTTQEFIHDDVLCLIQDVRSLALVPDVIDALGAPTIDPPTRERMTSFLSDLAVTLQTYTQIRLLDADGIERVGVDVRDGVVTPISPTDLADRSDSTVIAATLDLAAGEVFISRVEWTAAEEPVVHVAARATDARGELVGIVTMTHDARALLGALDDNEHLAPGHVHMLLDADGHYLVYDNGGEAAAGVPGRLDASFAEDYPALVDLVGSDVEGFGQVGSDVAIWMHIDPLAYAESLLPGVVPSRTAEESDGWLHTPWTLVSVLPRAAILEDAPMRQPVGWVLAAIVIGLAGFASLAFAMTQAERQAFRRRAEEDRLEIADLYENAPVGYHSTDADGVIQRINRTELAWLGYERDEVVGQKTLLDFVAPESMDVAEQFLDDLRAGEGLHDVQILMQRKDGRQLPVAMSSTVRLEGSGAFAIARTSTVDIRERRRLEQKLVQQATTDALTGAMNRRSFVVTGTGLITNAVDEDQVVSLLALDIDHFKKVNDSYGHAAGDEALKTFVELCSSQLRELDIFARVGGEEFAALLPRASEEVATTVAERIRAAVESAIVRITVDGSPVEIQITCSIGVGTLTGDDDTLDRLLARSDAALYRAKRQGRNQVVRHRPTTP